MQLVSNDERYTKVFNKTTYFMYSINIKYIYDYTFNVLMT